MQDWIVAMIVAYATWVVVNRYMPTVVTQFVREQIARTLAKNGWSGVANRLEQKRQRNLPCTDGCRTCSGCGSKREFVASPDKVAGSSEANCLSSILVVSMQGRVSR